MKARGLGYASVSKDVARPCVPLTKASDIRLGLVAYAYYESFADGMVSGPNRRIAPRILRAPAADLRPCWLPAGVDT